MRAASAWARGTGALQFSVSGRSGMQAVCSGVAPAGAVAVAAAGGDCLIEGAPLECDPGCCRPATGKGADRDADAGPCKKWKGDRVRKAVNVEIDCAHPGRSGGYGGCDQQERPLPRKEGPAQRCEGQAGARGDPPA